MADRPAADPPLVFALINGLVRTAGLYTPLHPQTAKAKAALLEALAAWLGAHGRLAFRFVGDLLVANDRILARESLVYRRFIETCQTERRIGSIAFTPGVEEREIDALFEALTAGVGESLAAWTARKRLVHLVLGPPVEPDRHGGEIAARRAYYGAIETLRDIEATVRARAPVSVEQLGSLRVFTSVLLEQVLETPALVLRLASIKSYDEYTLYHSVNVAVLSVGLGITLGLPEGLLKELAMAGMLHDLGKIAVPLEILQKPGLLTDEEWKVMRRHPVLGANLLSRLPGSNRLPLLVAFEHHMRHDRRGYPLVREEWSQHPISQLACVADVFDAMTSRRAYKQALPAPKVCAYVREESGRFFDPRMVAVLHQMLGSLRDAPAAEAPR